MNKKITLLACVITFILISQAVFAVHGCKPTFDINTTEELNISPGETKQYNATIWNIKCGLMHAVLKIDDLPEEWVNISPAYIASVAPFQTGTYNISISIPENTSYGQHIGTYKVWATEAQTSNYTSMLSNIITKQDIQVNVVEKREVVVDETPDVVHFEEDVPKDWTGNMLLYLLLVLLAAALVLVAFFVEYETKKKRLPRILKSGKPPEKVKKTARKVKSEKKPAKKVRSKRSRK